jgi:hypothetical protein
MDENFESIIRVHKNFYRDNYRKGINILLVLSVVVVVLIAATFYVVVHRPDSNYYATSSDGALISLAPVQPSAR